MFIVFLAGVVNFIVSIPINIIMGAGIAGLGGGQDPMLALLSQLIQVPIGFLVLAGLVTAMLPTSFGRACLAVLFYYLICIVIGVVIAIPLILIMGMGGLR